LCWISILGASAPSVYISHTLTTTDIGLLLICVYETSYALPNALVFSFDRLRFEEKMEATENDCNIIIASLYRKRIFSSFDLR
jgi:hypothetical protein